MTIREVEQRVGITKNNIRFYERMGLLKPDRERENHYRNYSESDINRLKMIRLLRSLYVPVGEIKSVLEEELSAATCLRRHAVSLTDSIENLKVAKLLCDKIGESESAAIDVDAYIEEIRLYEQKGVLFMNVKKNDTLRKMVTPILCAAVMIALAGAFVWLFVWGMTLEDRPPLPLAIIFIAIPVCIAGGILLALVDRFKEIKKGEIDEARKY